MSFSFQCPHCKAILEVADSLLGKTVRCSACSNLIQFDPEAFETPPEGSGVEEQGEVVDLAGMADNDEDTSNPYSARSDEELIASTESGSKGRPAWKGESEVPAAREPAAPAAILPHHEVLGDDGEEEGLDVFEPPKNDDRVDEELDMTPMVDVTFLLLIFFMVTASFTLQKSMDLPTKTQDEPSPNVVEDFEDNPEYVSVFVSPYNEYRIRTSEYDWEDAPNRHELRVRLTDALQAQSRPEKMLIMAHADCFHDKVIQAMDIGIELQYKIQVIMTEEEF